MTTRNDMPRLGLGTFGRTGTEGTRAILKALEIGYRHIDTAQSYDTEVPVGTAIRQSGLARKDVFVTTKIADTRLEKSQVLPSVEASLKALCLDQVDLLLIHWPSAKDAVPFEDYMRALAEAQQRHYTRLIGVSNFAIAHLEQAETLLGQGALATNQVELHPYLQAPKLRTFARERSVALTAYRPLAMGDVAKDPVIRRIAERHASTPGAVTLAFLMAEGHTVIPASKSKTNLRANFAATKLALTPTDMADLRKLDRGERRVNPEKSPRWDD